jgi:type IX secretion system PorP/SprF family membrane protein
MQFHFKVIDIVRNYTFTPSLTIQMLKRTLFSTLLFALPIISFAQEQANFTQFYLNPYILNPSFAGIDGKTAVSLIYRKQWIGIDGGPAITNFSLHTPINTRTSTGLSVTNDSRGLLNNTSLLLSLGYNAALGTASYLRFGLSAGASWNMVDWKKLDGFNDQAMANLSDNHLSLAGNAGISYHLHSFHIGVAIPHIFSPSYTSENGFEVSEIKPFNNMIFHTSKRFYFNKNKNIFEPYLNYRLNFDSPSQIEGAGILHLNHVVWLGGSYRQDFGVSALGGLKLKNSLAIGASYSLSNSGANQLNSPTFEISLNMLIGAHKKGTHVYSFVDTHKEKEKKTHVADKHKQEELARKKQLDAEAKKREAEALAKHQAEIKKREEERKNEAVTTKPPVKKDSAAHTPRFSQQMTVTSEIQEGHHEHEQEQLKRLEIHADNALEHHNEEGHPHAERHEFVKRGGHAKELEVSDYVVGGVFRGEPNAKHFSEGLNKLGFETHYGHLTEKNLWYVYVIKTTDINTARAERDRVRKMNILKDAWLLTVHN